MATVGVEIVSCVDYALDSGILLTWTDLARSRQGRSLFIDAAGAARPLDLDRAPDQWLWGVWERNNRLIYATAGGTSDTGQAINNAIRSVPLAPGRPSPALLAISYAGDQGAPGVSDSSVSWNVGALGLAATLRGRQHGGARRARVRLDRGRVKSQPVGRLQVGRRPPAARGVYQ